MANRYRSAALRFVRSRLADLPAERRATLADELEALLRAADLNNSSNRDRTAYMRTYMRDRRAAAKRAPT